MQGIYNYVPETNHVSRVYSVVAVRYLQFVLHVMLCVVLLCWYLSQYVFRAQYGSLLYSLNFLLSWYVAQVCLSDSEMVPVAPIITGITFAFTFHMR
jgi:hypothetical protein